MCKFPPLADQLLVVSPQLFDKFSVLVCVLTLNTFKMYIFQKFIIYILMITFQDSLISIATVYIKVTHMFLFFVSTDPTYLLDS